MFGKKDKDVETVSVLDYVQIKVTVYLDLICKDKFFDDDVYRPYEVVVVSCKINANKEASIKVETTGEDLVIKEKDETIASFRNVIGWKRDILEFYKQVNV